MFWALLRLILALLRLILNESKSGPKHIYAREHKLYCYIVIIGMNVNTFHSTGCKKIPMLHFGNAIYKETIV